MNSGEDEALSRLAHARKVAIGTFDVFDQEYAKLKERKNRLGAIIKSLDANCAATNASSTVKLNVGGRRIELSRQAILNAAATSSSEDKSSNLLADLIGGRWDKYLLKDKKGLIFLDFEPAWITPLLDHIVATAKAAANPAYPVAPPRVARPHEQLGFDSVVQKFRLSNQRLPQSLLFETSTIACLNDPVYQDSIAGFLRAAEPISPSSIYQSPSPPHSRLELLYRGSRDGFAASAFHGRCDNKGSTISVIQDTNGNVFGGFSDVPWSSPSPYEQYKASSKSFLFSLQTTAAAGAASAQQESRAVRFPLKGGGATNAHAVGHYSLSMSAFGGGCDLCIDDQCNSNSDSYTNMGHTYDDLGGGPHRMTSGQKKFQVREIEVYRVVLESSAVGSACIHSSSSSSSNSLPPAAPASSSSSPPSSSGMVGTFSFVSSSSGGISGDVVAMRASAASIVEQLNEALQHLDGMRAEVEEQEARLLREVQLVEAMVVGASSSKNRSSETNKKSRNGKASGPGRSSSSSSPSSFSSSSLLQPTGSGSSSSSAEGGIGGDDGKEADSSSLLTRIEAALGRIAEAAAVAAASSPSSPSQSTSSSSSSSSTRSKNDAGKKRKRSSNVSDDQGSEASAIVYLNVGGETVCIRKQALLLAAPHSQLATRVAFGGTDSSSSHNQDGLFIDEPIECFKSIIAYLRLKALLLELERAEGGGGGVAATTIDDGNKIYITAAQLPDLTRMLDYYSIDAPYQVIP